MGRRLFVFFMLLGFSLDAKAQSVNLDSLQLFHRCYAQISQSSPFENPNYAAIKSRIQAGGDPISECMSVVKSAEMTSGSNRLPSTPNNEIVLSVLNTFHQLHYSWFADVSVPNNVGGGVPASRIGNFYDSSEPALYLLNALFVPNTPVQSIWESSERLRSIRSMGVPNRTLFFVGNNSADREDMVFATNTPFAEQGRLQGIKEVGDLVIDHYNTTATTTPVGQLNFGVHFGMGAFGSASYLMTTVDEGEGLRFVSDGALKMPRKWAKKVFHDLLCRELPVVRFDDVPEFVLSRADSQEFRKSQGCVQCHASMDRMAATVRGFRYVQIDSSNRPGSVFVVKTAPTSAEETGTVGWQDVADNNFHKRPTKGVFYFRDYTGQLHNVSVNGPADLGTHLTNMDDPYICLAKRYYTYFLGTQVTVGDPGPSRSIASEVSDVDQRHYDQVVQLGQSLKADKNLMNLIEGILRLPDYRKHDFGAHQ